MLPVPPQLSPSRHRQPPRLPLPATGPPGTAAPPCSSLRAGCWSAASRTASRPPSPGRYGSAAVPRAWFEWQLSPGGIPDAAADDLVTWWPGLAFEGADSWDRQVREVEFGWQLTFNYQRWLLQRRIVTRRQVHEVMTEFWEHHLHVPAVGDSQFVYRKRYGDTIRRHALGRFDDLLQAAITEPAMLLFLDQAVSTKAAPNENLARELLELHTVGRGNHTEDDVKNVARVLTGWKVDRWRTWAYGYAPEWHATGRVDVLGWTHANASADGREATHLAAALPRPPPGDRDPDRPQAGREVRLRRPAAGARRPARARPTSTTTPPSSRCCGRSSTPRSSRPARARRCATPTRTSSRPAGCWGSRVTRPTSDQERGQRLLWSRAALGTLPMDWPRPDGQPQTSRAWSSPARLLGSMRRALVAVRRLVALAGRPLPRRDGSWVPDYPMRFDLSSTTSRRCCSTVRRPRRCCRRAARPPASGPASGSPATTRWSPGRCTARSRPSSTPPPSTSGDRHGPRSRALLRGVRRGLPARACSPAPPRCSARPRPSAPRSSPPPPPPPSRRRR